MTLDELKNQMTAAVKTFQETGDMTAIQTVTKAMDKFKADVAKETAVKLQAEAAQLAGGREKLASAVHGQIKALGIDKLITDVKGWGFTYLIDGYLRDGSKPEPFLTHKSVSLTTAVVKAHKAGTGGTGRRGGLQEDFDKVAEQYAKANSVDIQAEMAAALEKDKTVSNQGYSYNVKKKVQKWGIAQGLIQPVK